VSYDRPVSIASSEAVLTPSGGATER
jgi:hypothetical protein